MMIETMPDRTDFETRDHGQWQWLKHRPECSCCGGHIQEESAVRLMGDFYCDDCLDSMRVYIDDELQV